MAAMGNLTALPSNMHIVLNTLRRPIQIGLKAGDHVSVSRV
jgi:hypothetical protein